MPRRGTGVVAGLVTRSTRLEVSAKIDRTTPAQAYACVCPASTEEARMSNLKFPLPLE